MEYTYIKFASLTQAQAGKNLLSNFGMNVRLKRNPNPNRQQGCNFAIFVDGDVFKAQEILKQHRVETLGLESFRG